MSSGSLKIPPAVPKKKGLAAIASLAVAPKTCLSFKADQWAFYRAVLRGFLLAQYMAQRDSASEDEAVTILPKIGRLLNKGREYDVLNAVNVFQFDGVAITECDMVFGMLKRVTKWATHKLTIDAPTRHNVYSEADYYMQQMNQCFSGILSDTRTIEKQNDFINAIMQPLVPLTGPVPAPAPAPGPGPPPPPLYFIKDILIPIKRVNASSMNTEENKVTISGSLNDRVNGVFKQSMNDKNRWVKSRTHQPAASREDIIIKHSKKKFEIKNEQTNDVYAYCETTRQLVGSPNLTSLKGTKTWRCEVSRGTYGYYNLNLVFSSASDDNAADAHAHADADADADADAETEPKISLLKIPFEINEGMSANEYFEGLSVPVTVHSNPAAGEKYKQVVPRLWGHPLLMYIPLARALQCNIVVYTYGDGGDGDDKDKSATTTTATNQCNNLKVLYNVPCQEYKINPAPTIMLLDENNSDSDDISTFPAFLERQDEYLSRFKLVVVTDLYTQVKEASKSKNDSIFKAQEVKKKKRKIEYYRNKILKETEKRSKIEKKLTDATNEIDSLCTKQASFKQIEDEKRKNLENKIKVLDSEPASIKPPGEKEKEKEKKVDPTGPETLWWNTAYPAVSDVASAVKDGMKKYLVEPIQSSFTYTPEKLAAKLDKLISSTESYRKVKKTHDAAIHAMEDKIKTVDAEITNMQSAN